MMEPAYCLQGNTLLTGNASSGIRTLQTFTDTLHSQKPSSVSAPRLRWYSPGSRSLSGTRQRYAAAFRFFTGISRYLSCKDSHKHEKVPDGSHNPVFLPAVFQHHSASLRNSVSGIIFHRNVFHFIPFSTKTLSLQEKVHLFSTGLKYQLDPWSAISSYGDLQFLRKSAAQTVRIKKFFLLWLPYLLIP